MVDDLEDKTIDARLLEFQLEMQELTTEREMMIAENKVRESLGQAMAYHGDSFANLALRSRELREKLIRFTGG